MQFSGYSEDVRYQALRWGLAGWEKQEKGNREKASQRAQTHRNKRNEDWYMAGGDCETVVCGCYTRVCCGEESGDC